MNQICSISKYPIRVNKDWIFTSEDGKYKMEVSIIGHNIIHLTNYGYTSFKVGVEIHSKVESIINQEFQDKDYFIIYNYQYFKGISIKARNYYVKWMIENTPQIQGVYFYNTNSFTNILVKTSSLILRKNFFIHKNYEEVILKIKGINNSFESTKNITSKLRLQDYCSISGYTIKSPDSWVFSADNNKYRLEVSLISDNIINIKNVGYATIEITDKVWPLMFTIPFKELEGKNFFLMHDYSHYKGATSEVRNNYISWLKDNSEKILGVYFYNLTPLTKILINSGRLLFKEFKDLYVFNSYAETILSIKKIKDVENRDLLGNYTEEWNPGQVLASVNNKTFTVIKSWYHTYESAKIATYLINENIFVRKYKGDLTEEISEETEKNFLEILNECNLVSYHFYTQFNADANLTLKYRSHGVKWFNENRAQILTAGFFNYSFINRVAINIAKSFFYHKDFKKRVFMLETVDEIFETIEDYYLPKVSLELEYSKKSKDEIIKLMIKTNEENKALLVNQGKEIAVLYNKLGRLSWDEDYNFEEKDMDLRGNAFSDLNNAILLIQEDVKGLLIKRDSIVKKAKESDRLKSAFLANMSHEIRTPLNSIIGFSSLLAESSEDEDTIKRFAGLIVENGDNLLNLINDIIDVSKIEAGELVIVKEDFSIYNLVTNTAIVYNNIKFEKNKNLSFLIDNRIDENLSIISDKLRIQQIINNLINNAFKFTEKGYVKLTSVYEDRFLSIKIEDTGVGIDEEKQSVIFDRFRQEEDETAHFYGGSGLGLSISKSLAQMLGGNIFLTSEKGKGSVFELRLPVEIHQPAI